MEIIPVIDVMRGIVVQADGSDRQQYPPLKSVLTQHIEIEKVLVDLLNLYPFRTIYVADLDAIFKQDLDLALYKMLVKSFPDVIFWLDAGIQSKQHWDLLNDISGLIPVIGSETLTDLTVLKMAKQGVLSLDFQHGEFLGDPTILQQAELWPDNIIVMNLDCVGTQTGPDIELLQQIKSKRTDVNIIAAGGVRDRHDLAILEQNDIAATLVASALHDGSLTAEIIAQY